MDEDGALRVGGAALATRVGVGVSCAMKRRNGNASVVSVLRGQTGALEAAAQCASRGWMTILVGPPASGKTSVAQCLADLAGRTLRRVALTAATDTSELLGSFEQKEPARDRAALEEVVSTTLRRVAADALGSFSSSSSDGGEENVIEKRDTKHALLDVVERAWSRWSSYESIVDAASRGARAEDAASAKEALSAVVDAVAEARDTLAARDATEGRAILLQTNYAMDVDGDVGDDVVNDADPLVSSIRERLASLGPEAWGGAAPSAGRFEWVDGVLLKAATTGEWVLLENANLCSPTVLDRLNPLLETGGSLLVSECGHGADGEPRVVRAHPEFRLFLALDPRRGEVSRAMRNRGVEVFMSGVPDDSLAEESLAAEESSERRALDIRSVRSVSEDEAKTPLVSSSDAFPSSRTLATFAPVDDLEGVLAAAGVPAGAPRRAMARAHRALVAGDCVSSSELGPETSSETAEARGIRVARARRSVAARFAALTHREASRWAALTSELLARGVGAENALRVAWTHVYERGEVSEDARRATRVAFARHVKPFLDATRRDFTEESIPRAGFLKTENVVDASLVARWARSTLVEPLGWPEPAATATPPADVESRARRAGALLETVAGTLYGRERAAADALSATNGR